MKIKVTHLHRDLSGGPLFPLSSTPSSLSVPDPKKCCSGSIPAAILIHCSSAPRPRPRLCLSVYQTGFTTNVDPSENDRCGPAKASTRKFYTSLRVEKKESDPRDLLQSFQKAFLLPSSRPALHTRRTRSCTHPCAGLFLMGTRAQKHKKTLWRRHFFPSLERWKEQRPF